MNLPHGLPGSRFEYRPASQSLSLRSLNATEQDKKTLEQFDEPFAGQSDSGDDGERDEPATAERAAADVAFKPNCLGIHPSIYEHPADAGYRPLIQT